MSTRITLESKQRLPGKVQDVICDSALIIQHATAASGCSEVLISTAKQICATEQFLTATSASLTKLDLLLDGMLQQQNELEHKITNVTDVLATVQTIERNKYFTEEGLRAVSESDVDSYP